MWVNCISHWKYIFKHRQKTISSFYFWNDLCAIYLSWNCNNALLFYSCFSFSIPLIVSKYRLKLLGQWIKIFIWNSSRLQRLYYTNSPKQFIFLIVQHTKDEYKKVILTKACTLNVHQQDLTFTMTYYRRCITHLQDIRKRLLVQ